MEIQNVRLCIEARNRLAEIQNKQISLQAKILLLQGLKQNLKDTYQFQTSKQIQKHKCDLNATFFTSSRSTMLREDEEGLIQQILKSQMTKIQNDEEIETCEDDLNQITKTIISKQKYNDELGVKIALKNKEIQEQKSQQKKLTKVKSSPSLFQKIFG